MRWCCRRSSAPEICRPLRTQTNMSDVCSSHIITYSTSWNIFIHVFGCASPRITSKGSTMRFPKHLNCCHCCTQTHTHSDACVVPVSSPVSWMMLSVKTCPWVRLTFPCLADTSPITQLRGFSSEQLELWTGNRKKEVDYMSHNKRAIWAPWLWMGLRPFLYTAHIKYVIRLSEQGHSFWNCKSKWESPNHTEHWAYECKWTNVTQLGSPLLSCWRDWMCCPLCCTGCWWHPFGWWTMPLQLPAVTG